MKKTIFAAACAMAACSFGEILVKDGDTLAFLGDSITQQGQQNPDGYVNLTIRALASEGVNVKPVKAGISGHKSDNMLARLNRDVLSKKPRWMTLSCGVNDVWHQDYGEGKGVKPETDKADYIAQTKAILGAVRAEPGCLEYRLLGDCDTSWTAPQRFGERTLWMLEKWASVTSLKAHLQTPHMKAFGPKVSGMRSASTFHVLEDVAD